MLYALTRKWDVTWSRISDQIVLLRKKSSVSVSEKACIMMTDCTSWRDCVSNLEEVIC